MTAKSDIYGRMLLDYLMVQSFITLLSWFFTSWSQSVFGTNYLPYADDLRQTKNYNNSNN